MICVLVETLIRITEGFPNPHSVIHNFVNNGQSITSYNRPQQLHPMSPGHLFRKSGLNVTKHNQIMKKNGISHETKRKK
jgi:hypothetical protein